MSPLLLFFVVAASAGGNNADLANLVEDALDVADNNNAATTKGDGEEEYEVAASDLKDATAHAVDQTLVGKAEEELAAKESKDPLLADPLVSLENDHEGEEGLDTELEALDASMEEEEEKLFYDPKLFSRDTVAEMDKNNDGYLDEDELVAHLTAAIDKVRKDEFEHQKAVNADGVKEIMEMMDDNHDGTLSKEELFGKTTQNPKQRVSDNRMFNFADGAFGKKDGQLDANELFIMALPQYAEDRHAWYKFKAEDHLETMDTDGDSQVTFKEYDDAIKMVQAAPEEMDAGHNGFLDSVGPATGGVTKDFFEAADSNSDEKLDVDELAVLVANLEKRNMKDTVDGLIEIADDNKDGKLALNEIIEHVDDFGGHISFFLNDPDLLFPTAKRNDIHLPSNTKGTVEKKKFVIKALAHKKRSMHHASEQLTTHAWGNRGADIGTEVTKSDKNLRGSK